MDSVEVEVPLPAWRSQLVYVAETLRNTTRWALVCPRPKKKSHPFFFGTQEEPEIEASWFRIVSETVTTIVVTLAAAAVLLYVVDYFVQFCYSVGIVLSGRDCVTPTHSRPGSPNRSPSNSPPDSLRGPDPGHIVKMNQPVDCVARRTLSSISLASTSRSREYVNNRISISSTTTNFSSVSSTKPTSSNSTKNMDSSESSQSDSASEPRFPAGSEATVAENAFFDFDHDVPVATVFGGPRDDGKLETVGSFDLDKPGKVHFIWMERNVNVSITGSFFGYNLSVPLQKEANWCSFVMTMPIGKYEYEFVVEGQSSSEDSEDSLSE